MDFHMYIHIMPHCQASHNFLVHFPASFSQNDKSYILTDM